MLFFHLIFIYLFLTVNVLAQVDPEPATSVVNKDIVSSRSYMVVAANPHAVKAGNDILAIGGSAIDAAIAVQMVLNVVEPQSSGIGGGGFLLYYDAKTKNIVSFDGRETAPKKIDENLFLKEDGNPKDFYDAVQGGTSVGVPGLVAMLDMAHKEYGKLSWQELFDPAIDIATEGFKMSFRLHEVAKSVDYLNKFSGASEMLLDEDGNVKNVNSVLYNSKLAKTFKLISKRGIEVFYQGNIAKNIAYTVKNSSINPGSLTYEDLQSYKAIKRSVYCSRYHAYKICSMAPPSSGATTILQALTILENYNLNDDKSLAKYLILEATKLSFADRDKYIADPDYINVPVDKILDENYVSDRAKLIDMKKTKGIYEAGNLSDEFMDFEGNMEAPSTTHISIIDQYGNAVSLTSSVEHAFGSVLTTDGFFLNNQLTDFSFKQEEGGKKVANSIKGGKRPRSSMSPTIILDSNDNLFMVIGSPGGSNIISYVLKTIIAVIDWDMNIQDAIYLPNFVNKNQKDTYLEVAEFSIDDAKFLEAAGHNIIYKDLNSGLHGIMIKDGILYGGADPRREGMAMGN